MAYCAPNTIAVQTICCTTPLQLLTPRYECPQVVQAAAKQASQCMPLVADQSCLPHNLKAKLQAVTCNPLPTERVMVYTEIVAHGMACMMMSTCTTPHLYAIFDSLERGVVKLSHT